MNETVSDLVAGREPDYGDFAERAAKAQALKAIIQGGRSWSKWAAYQKEACDSICGKLSRLANGNPDKIDSWLDIAGYAQLVVDELREREESAAETPKTTSEARVLLAARAMENPETPPHLTFSDES